VEDGASARRPFHSLLDEVFGEERYVNTIVFKKKSATYSTETVFDCLLWYCKDRGRTKVRGLGSC